MDQIINISSSLINTTVGTAIWTLKPILSLVEKGVGVGNSTNQPQQIILRETFHTLPPNMRKWIVISGLMGASAVSIGTLFGPHVFYPRKEIQPNRKAAFDFANLVHSIHALALIGVPFARKSGLTGTLFVTGTLIFSGTSYYYAITDNKKVAEYARYGGVTLILAWLSFAL